MSESLESSVKSGESLGEDDEEINYSDEEKVEEKPAFFLEKGAKPNTPSPPQPKRVMRPEDRKLFGSYLPERQWGTVREDYSLDGSVWQHMSHHDAISRAYRWGEDGLLGICDEDAHLCCALALWNHEDPILKERLYGLTNEEGNHGEDVKELYYYLNNTPDHRYMSALYKYPMAAFPYELLRGENSRLTPFDPEFELLDTGVFDNEDYWDVKVEYAKDKSSPLTIYCCVTVINHADHSAQITVAPQIWFRNTWSWSDIKGTAPSHSMFKPEITKVSDKQAALSYCHGKFWAHAYSSADRVTPELIFTENETCPQQTTSPQDEEEKTGAGTSSNPNFYKDAFHKYILEDNKDAVNPEGKGTKLGLVYRLRVKSFSRTSLWWALWPQEGEASPEPPSMEHVLNTLSYRHGQANRYYSKMVPKAWGPLCRQLGSQAVSGLLWTKMFYCFSPAQRDRELQKKHEEVPESRSLEEWHHLHNKDIILVPDKWEFPWYAPWDLAFHVVSCSRVDKEFAQQQLRLFVSDRYMHPEGPLPSCEFDFNDANPPLHPWACLRVFESTHDHFFLEGCYKKLVSNFDWWTKQESGGEGTFLYHLGFLGLDNISILNRSQKLPEGHFLQQADATGWVAFYSLSMLLICLELAPTYLEYYSHCLPFLSHFGNVAKAMCRPVEDGGLWCQEDHLFCDVYVEHGTRTGLAIESWVALMPLFACCAFSLPDVPEAASLYESLMESVASLPQHVINFKDRDFLLTLTPLDELRPILAKVFDESKYLSPFGIRSLSKQYLEKPYEIYLAGEQYLLNYVPGESDSHLFGGNSNWRGPIWLPMNYLLVEALEVYSRLPEKRGLQLEFPTGSGTDHSLQEIVRLLSQRVVDIFLPDREGNRPLHGDQSRYSLTGSWKDLILFYEYYHADTGKGCGASHQTGWSALALEFLHKAKGSTRPA